MPNKVSAKKALRQSKTRQIQNTSWKRRVKETVKKINKLIEEKVENVDIIKQELNNLYKTADKAAKTKAIHVNKAIRVKSKMAQKVTAHEQLSTGSTTKQKSKSQSSK